MPPSARPSTSSGSRISTASPTSTKPGPSEKRPPAGTPPRGPLGPGSGPAPLRRPRRERRVLRRPRLDAVGNPRLRGRHCADPARDHPRARGARGPDRRRVSRALHLTAVAALAGLLVLQARPRWPTARAWSSSRLRRFRNGGGASVRTLRGRSVAPHSALRRTNLLPRCLSLLLARGDARSRERARAARTRGLLADAGDRRGLRRDLDEVAPRRGRRDRRRALPSFAALARDSTWFRNAATVDAWTVNAVPSILTGLYSEHGRLPVFAEHPDNLFTLLGGSHRLEISESLTQLCPHALCPEVVRRPFSRRMESLLSDVAVLDPHLVLPRDLRRRLPSVSDTWGAFLESSHERTRRRIYAFEDFLASLDGGGGPPLPSRTSCSPTSPGSSCPRGVATRAGTCPASRRAAGATTSSSASRATSATCSSSDSPIGSSATSFAACAPPDSTIERFSSLPPITA